MAFQIDPDMDQILKWCGFTKVQDRKDISQDGFQSFDDIMALTEKDITDLGKGFADRDTKIIFGLQRTNRLKSMIHWIQDFERVSRIPSLVDLDNLVDFKHVVELAYNRSKIRKSTSEDLDGISKAADPGKLQNSLIGPNGREALITTSLPSLGLPEYLSTM
jgi:hypothetical protein